MMLSRSCSSRALPSALTWPTSRSTTSTLSATCYDTSQKPPIALLHSAATRLHRLRATERLPLRPVRSYVHPALRSASTSGGSAGDHDKVPPMTGKRRKPVTAAELLAELEQDPDFVAGQQRDREPDEANRRQYQREATPVLSELAELGYHVRSMKQLRLL